MPSKGKEYDGHAMDLWTLGVVLYHMSTGSLPFQENIYETLQTTLAGKYSCKNQATLDICDGIADV
jgi:serine/threonine protein kinase